MVLEVVKRSADQTGFAVIRRRWVVERTFAWIIKNRRFVRDYEQLTALAETLITIAAQLPSSGDGPDPISPAQTHSKEARLNLCGSGMTVLIEQPCPAISPRLQGCNLCVITPRARRTLRGRLRRAI
jgi:hypothetical protein